MLTTLKYLVLQIHLRIVWSTDPFKLRAEGYLFAAASCENSISASLLEQTVSQTQNSHLPLNRRRWGITMCF